MTAEKRKPGPVAAKARSLDITDKEDVISRHRPREKNGVRLPGPVNEQTEVIADDSESQAEIEAPLLPEVTESSPWKIFFPLLVCTFFVWLLSEVAVTLLRAYREKIIWVWGPLAVVTAGLLGAFFWAVCREIKAFRGVDTLADRKKKINAMVTEHNLQGLHKVLAPTLENLRKRYPSLIGDFENAVVERYAAEDYLKQFDNIVLSQLDKEAQAAIKHCVFTGSMGVAISPHPALDGFFVLWRSKVLVRTIGEIYGLQPTGLSSMRLLKHAVTSAMIAATLEKSGEIAVTEVVQSVPLRIFKPVAEGATTAIRLYRLGRITQQVCRPVTMAGKQGQAPWLESDE